MVRLFMNGGETVYAKVVLKIPSSQVLADDSEPTRSTIMGSSMIVCIVDMASSGSQSVASLASVKFCPGSESDPIMN
jgi:hypothetical protein